MKKILNILLLTLTLSAMVALGVYFAYDYFVKWVSSQNATWFSQIVSDLVPFAEISQYLLIGFIGGGAFIGLFGCVAFVGKHLNV